jgi:hypothetical protein
MKQIIQAVFFLVCGTNVFAQTIYSEDFTSVATKAIPAQWQVSSNTDVTNYQRPFADCIADKGLLTPGVGQNAPTRFILPPFNFDAANSVLKIRFKLFVLDANLRCNTAKPFPCPTYVRIMLVKCSYDGGTRSLPVAEDIYAEQSYQMLNANAENTVIFQNPPVASGACYKIYFDFKTGGSNGCSSSCTKFIFDDFIISKSPYVVPSLPVASNDYFDASRQGFVNLVKGNVYGGCLLWASEAPAGFEKASLMQAPAVNNGLDYDEENHDLSAMQFVLVSNPVVVNSTGCTGTPSPGTLTWNGDGTFEFLRTNVCVNRISFQYKVIDPGLLQSNVATVTIDFPANSPLPVNFYSFTAQRYKTDVLLKWQTASEMNCKGFFVQRNNGDGWIDRGFVFSYSDGNSNSMLSYEFHEVNTFTNPTQYRLAEQDMDGQITYSSIVVVEGTAPLPNVVVYPNPSTTGSVRLVMPKQGLYAIELYDAAGRKLKEWKKFEADALTINNLNNGTFLVTVKDIVTNKIFSTRFMVANGLAH